MKKTTSKPLAPKIMEASALIEQNKFVEAETILQEFLKKFPKDGVAYNAMGVLYKKQNDVAKAIESFLLAIKYDPKNSSPIFNLGNAYMQLNEIEKASEFYGKAVRIAPKNSEHHRLYAQSLLRLGDRKKAITSLQSAITVAPKDVRARMDLCGVYLDMNKNDEALNEIDKVIVIAPNNIQMRLNRSIILKKLGFLNEAISYIDAIIAQFPKLVEPLLVNGNFYHYNKSDFETANKYYARAYALEPDNLNVIMRYCECLLNSRYGSEAEHLQHSYELAIKMLDKGEIPVEFTDGLQKVFLRTADAASIEKLGARERMFDYWMRNMNIGALHNQLGRVITMEDRQFLVKLHREWGKRTEQSITPLPAPPTLRNHNKIRIGLMSSDLRDHPVTYFALPIIQYFDREKFEVNCYSFYPKAIDNVQEFIIRQVSKFTTLPTESDLQIAQVMRNDGIDILFELGGTTFLNKVQVCSYRPAPVNVSWLGYPHSVGLSEIDYILTDPYITPEDKKLLIEKPFELANSWVTLGNLGFPDVPIVEQIPFKTNGYITFGTMNNPYKYTPDGIAAWAQILNQVDNSRMLFVRPEGGAQAFRTNLQREFAKHGVVAKRIIFEPKRGKHLPYYNQIDIALDTFPHTGGTTTCETLWMGVPVVSMVGPAFFERLSYSNINNAGIKDMCAFSVEDYVKIAVELSKDAPRLQYLRQNLRTQIRQNPLGLQQQWVRDFETKTQEVLNIGQKSAA